MKHYRMEMQDYHNLISEEGDTLERYEINEAVRGALPNVVPNS